MLFRADAGSRLFLRYALNNLLIFILPLALASVFYAVSIRTVESGVNETTTSQLTRSKEEIERLIRDMEQMAIELINDYDVSFYLSSPGPFTGSEYYHLKAVSRRIAPWVFGNPLLDHAFLYMEKSGFIVFENGYGEYDWVYRSLFSAEQFTAAQWRDEILSESGDETFVPNQVITMGGETSTGHVYRRPIGTGENFLGMIIGVVDRGDLGRALADVPERYGGWVYVQDSAGNLLSSTDPDYGSVERVLSLVPETGTFTYQDEKYRVYRIVSSFNGWQYTAILNQNRVFAGVRAVRNVALVLFGVSFAIGLTISYLFASASSRPIGRLFKLVLGEAGNVEGNTVSVYEQVEQAIVLLSDSRKQLQLEVNTSERVVLTYFFQNLLRGRYRTRAEYERERALFDVHFAPAPYYVTICRFAALHAAVESESFVRFRASLVSSAESLVGDSDFAVPMSFDDLAIVQSCADPRRVRADAVTFLEKLRDGLPAALRGAVTFGVGEPANEPYLLIISYEQALSAASSLSPSGHSVMEFYSDTPRGFASYYYPMDLEENIVRAVRSNSTDLLDNLMESARRENFEERTLSGEQLQNLFVEIQGTVLRLLNDLTQDAESVHMRLSRWSETPSSRQKIDEARTLLGDIATEYDTGKKSHNSALLNAIRQYIVDNYSDTALSLTRIADLFGKSENYISNFYKEQSGEGLLVFIQKTRFDHAASRLLRSGESVDTIARECGYVHTDSFRRAFKRMNGLSPSEYRRTMTVPRTERTVDETPE